MNRDRDNARSTKHERLLSFSERVYRLLLVAYPERFRREYERQMIQVFGDLCRRECRRVGTLGVIRLWISTLLDLGVSALGERGREFGRIMGKEVIVGNYRLAGIGFALLLAPLFFVSASLLKYGLGIGLLFDPLEHSIFSDPQRLRVFNLVSPIIFLGGLGVALALNTHALLRLSVSREDGALVGTVRLEPRLLNMVVVAVSASLLVILLGYAFLENFTPRYG